MTLDNPEQVTQASLLAKPGHLCFNCASIKRQPPIDPAEDASRLNVFSLPYYALIKQNPSCNKWQRFPRNAKLIQHRRQHTLVYGFSML